MFKIMKESAQSTHNHFLTDSLVPNLLHCETMYTGLNLACQQNRCLAKQRRRIMRNKTTIFRVVITCSKIGPLQNLFVWLGPYILFQYEIGIILEAVLMIKTTADTTSTH